jgi:acyl-homoserine lactone acylase PvdQ
MGWLQAEDRPEELLKNFLRGMGEIASVEGPGAVRSDLIALLWDNYNLCRSRLDNLSPRTRRLTQAYVRGVNEYYRHHPQDLPEWWGERQVDEAMVHAFGRLFLYNWSISDGFQDLRRGGIEPNFAPASGASNQWAVAPSRSAEGVPILLIDPHLGWLGASRFWEFRIHAGEMIGSGFTLPGFPTIGLGHTRYLAWAMTTGGPDTADIYELTLDSSSPPRYLYDGAWRDLRPRQISLQVAGVGTQNLTLLDSHLGPVVALQGNRAWVHRTAYAHEVGALDAWYTMVFGRDYRAAMAALDTLSIFPQNVMVADTSGNIYYQRTGKVPVRPPGFDFSRPVDGSTSATDWRGFHPSSELVQLLNPERGYMQNCNIPPDAMLVDSPLQPDRHLPYIFSDQSHAGGGGLGGWTNPRGARAVELLEADSSVTAEEAIAYAMDVRAFGADRWVQLLQQARRQGGGGDVAPEVESALADLSAWDRQLHPDSTGALKYFLWRERLDASEFPSDLSAEITDLTAPLGRSRPLPELNDVQQHQLWDAFAASVQELNSRHGRLDVTWGEIFRVGRGDRSWPVGGGGGHGTTTLRNVEYGSPRPDGTRWGDRGQTSTQVVVLSSPIRSWTVTPLGQSDRPQSPHFTDQAERLFSPGRMKPTWWTPEELAEHIESRTVLPFH